MQQKDTELFSIDDFHLSGVHDPFALEAIQNLASQDATVGPAMAFFKEDDLLFNSTLVDSEPNLFYPHSSFDDFIHSNDPPPTCTITTDLFSCDMTDGITMITDLDYTSSQQKTENTIMETELERSISQYSLPSQGGSDFTDYDNTFPLPSDPFDQFTIESSQAPHVHIISQFCQFGSDQTSEFKLNSLCWFERKMRNGNSLTTTIPCSFNMARLAGDELCAGTCLATMDLGCLIPDCPVKAGSFNSEQDLHSHIREHINPPPSTELNFDNLERLPQSYHLSPSLNRSLSQLSAITSGNNTIYSTSSLTNSPCTRWNQITAHLTTSQASSSIATTASPTLSHRALSEHSYAHSTDSSTKNTQSRRKAKSTRTTNTDRKKELPCPHTTCARSERGNGFRRSDNLLNHRRQVHGEDTGKLPKGRKKRVP